MSFILPYTRLDPIRNFLEVKIDGTFQYGTTETSVVLVNDAAATELDTKILTQGNVNLVWYNYTKYKTPELDPNKEIIRTRGRLSGTTLEIQRPGATANNPVVAGVGVNLDEGDYNVAKTHNIPGHEYRLMLTFTKRSYDIIDTGLYQGTTGDTGYTGYTGFTGPGGGGGSTGYTGYTGFTGPGGGGGSTGYTGYTGMGETGYTGYTGIPGPSWDIVPGTPTRIGGTSLSVSDVGNALKLDKLLSKCTILEWTDGGNTKQAMVTSATYGANIVTINLIGDILNVGFTGMKYFFRKAWIAGFAYAGTIGTIGTDVCGHFYSHCDMKLFGADIRLGVAGNGTMTIDLNDNGTSIFTTPPSISGTGVATVNTTATDGKVVLEGRKLTVDIDAIAATPGQDLYVYLYWIENLNTYL